MRPTLGRGIEIVDDAPMQAIESSSSSHTTHALSCTTTVLQTQLASPECLHRKFHQSPLIEAMIVNLSRGLSHSISDAYRDS